MAQRKYNTETAARTVTFYKVDLDILAANQTYRNSVTDQIQEAIKEYIERHGLTIAGPGTTSAATGKEEG